MTTPQKAKGYYYECKTVDELNSIPGCHAKRQLASGAYGKLDARLDGDILFLARASCLDCIMNDCCDDKIGYLNCNKFEPIGYKYKVEVKARTTFPKWIEHALTQGDITVLWKCQNGGSKGYVLMPIELFKEIIG